MFLFIFNDPNLVYTWRLLSTSDGWPRSLSTTSVVLDLLDDFVDVLERFNANVGDDDDVIERRIFSSSVTALPGEGGLPLSSILSKIRNSV